MNSPHKQKSLLLRVLGIDILISATILICVLFFYFQGLIFHNSSILYLLVLLIPAYYFFFSGLNLLQGIYRNSNFVVGEGRQVVYFTAKFFALKLSFIAIVLAFSDPVKGSEQKQVETEGGDIMVCLDLSRSMDVEDVQNQSRLETARNVLKSLTNKLSGHRIGLCVFADNSIVQLPLTLDYNRFKLMVSEVNTSYFSNQGTNISSALDNARRSFNRKGQKNSILLLTDGENHQEGYNAFIDSIVNDGIKLIAAAIGTETGGPILEGVNKQIRLDESGNLILSRVNLSLVKNIAEKSNGSWFHLTDAYPSPEAILTEINLNSTGDLRNLNYKIERRLYTIPLVISLFAIVFYLLLPLFLKERR